MRKIIGSILLIFALTLGATSNVRAAEKEVIRVGNFACENFMIEKDGKSQGYAVDYLEEISKYTNWDYEYIYDTWTNCLTMLENGELDMICMANYTEEREERFLYSKYPFGYEYALMYVLPETDIYFQDYDSMQGKNVGMMRDDANAEYFRDMAKEKNLRYKEICFDEDYEILQALYDKTIDIAMVGNMQNHEELRIIERLESKEIYCIFNKDDSETCAAFDMAMEEIVMNEGNIQGLINQKYYSSEKMSNGPMFTRQEVEFINNAGPIPVKMLSDTRPLGYIEDGEMQGIFWKYLQLISEVSGLQFEVLDSTTSSFDDETRKLAEDKAITFRSKNVIKSLEIDENVNLSNTIAENSLAYVKRKEDAKETGRTDYTYAITKEMSYLPAMIMAKTPDCTIKFYDTALECFEAVRNKEADVLIQDLYICKYWLKKPIFEQSLAEYQGIDYANSMCIVTPKEEQVLLSIINKSINYISEDRIQNVATMEFIEHPYANTLGDILFKYRSWIILTVFIVIVFGIIVKMLIDMMRSLKINKHDLEEIQMKMKKDDLTEAYNKNYFYIRSRELLDAGEEEMCIVMMDISNFKVVNDLFGWSNGDIILARVAEELMKLSNHEKFIVSRFNGDDFFLFMPREEFNNINLPRRINTGMNDMEVMLSYGVFFIEDKSIPVNIMCDRASMALHNNEDNTHESIKYYSENERAKILQQQEIENEMQKALDDRQFSLYVQPKYNVNKNKIVGGEALVRWIHPQKGMISPGIFIEIFEKNGFIVPLDYYIWEECCSFLSKLKRHKGTVEPISINVSRAHFYGKELRPKLKELIQKYHLEPKDLVLEITETACAQDHDVIYSKLRELQADGFKVAMDDFGSGYSSLNMLKEMPLDIIKMDLKFLDGGENEEKSHYILKTLILLAKQMNLEVVVEGVETGKQVDFLKNLQDVIAQGYFYSRPVESEKYEHMLESE